MNNSSASVTSIAQCLQNEKIAMHQLTTLLKDEETALVNNDIESLTQTISAKNDLVRNMSDLERQRNLLFQNLGYSDPATNLPDYLRSGVADDAIKELWDSILALSAQAKENNRTNGLLISRKLSQNQAALSIFQQGNPTASLYGPNGQSSIQTSPIKGLIVR
ncbi:flagella synthesis protein FlgN [Undibacterium oligocarboniphilum]|uniref:Flagellar protein FlgN n=1 Tax=Undibacterium oligocarboniphilum TaxID=666702 RepID=A0A850QKS4_9BURK|nr:flagellar protein FlgN [Undibacterium oligocarboniphilum]MBC3870144.1 flagellar protein FlgN [Undibacterium oligocarboniphilum]NVO78135.1 flagellar protein FlgN [Undibacterium oligocarboniphilum]